MERNTDIAPKYLACLLDVSAYCSPDFLEMCGGKVYQSGFFDDNLDTFICSPERMVFVEWIELVPESTPEDEAAREQLYEILIEEGTDRDDSYLSRRDVERLKVEAPERFKEVEIDLDPEEDASEQVRELLQGNPLF
jgi:hypothetical protein